MTESSGAADVSKSKTRAQALYQLGLTRLEQGDVREAYEELKEASRLDPGNLEVCLKYEEVYSAVQHLLAEEQERAAAQQASFSQDPEKKPHKADDDDMPPTFTFCGGGEPRAQSSTNRASTLTPSDAPMENSSGDTDDLSRQLQQRMFRGMLDSPVEANDRSNLGDLGFGELSSGVAEWEDQEFYLAFNMQSPKTFIAQTGCWMYIWFAVMYYYQVYRKAEEKLETNWWAVVGWSFFISAFHAASWVAATKLRLKHFSLSDGIKVACGIVIVLAVLWHKVWQEPELQKIIEGKANIEKNWGNIKKHFGGLPTIQ